MIKVQWSMAWISHRAFLQHILKYRFSYFSRLLQLYSLLLSSYCWNGIGLCWMLSGEICISEAYWFLQILICRQTTFRPTRWILSIAPIYGCIASWRYAWRIYGYNASRSPICPIYSKFLIYSICALWVGGCEGREWEWDTTHGISNNIFYLCHWNCATQRNARVVKEKG